MEKVSKGFAHLILIIGVVLIGIVGIAFYAIKNGQISISPPQKQKATYTTNNWRSFTTNEVDFIEDSFKFKYPENWFYETKSTTNKKGDQYLDVDFFSEGTVPYYNTFWQDASEGNMILSVSSQVRDQNWEKVQLNNPEVSRTEKNGYLVYRLTEKLAVMVNPKTNRQVRLLTNSEGEKYFDQILSTFEFIDQKDETTQSTPEGLTTNCNSNSDCQNYISTNTCEVYCTNTDTNNQQLINSLDKTCDATLWDPPLGQDCVCVNNNCVIN